MSIRVAIVGVGNCASALVQGVNYYKHMENSQVPGLAFQHIGGYRPEDIEFVLAYDVDSRKVGKLLNRAIFAKPNCARVFYEDCSEEVPVLMGNILDGVSDHMRNSHDEINFQVANYPSLDHKTFVEELKRKKVNVLLNYLPVGSEEATKFYIRGALEAKVAVVNCIPVFIASDPIWEKKFIDAGLPIIGDDMRSQFGASVLSQMLQELAYDRGCRVKFHQQINVGGNSDFLNMVNSNRIVSKKISKENVIRAQNDLRGIDVEKDSLFAGPSSFIPYLKDKKVAYFKLELEAFGGAPINVDVKLEVQDSENSAGVVIDAIRYLQVAREMGIVGALRGPSALTQKTPPKQMMFKDALYECEQMAKREYTTITWNQVEYTTQVAKQ
jgi:myo-inositol-1-phosphate synthase